MSGAMHLWWGDSLVHSIFSASYLWRDASFVWWFLGMMHHCWAASLVWCIYALVYLWQDASLVSCLYGVMHLWCAESLVRYIFVVLHLWWIISFYCNIPLMHCIFGALHLLWYIGTFGMLCNGIFGVLNRWCDATLVNYILVATFLWRTVSLVRRIFGVMCMHFWYAMHRHLWWCLVGVITIVQCIFGALSLGLGFNIFFLCCVFGAMHCLVSYVAQACYCSGASILYTMIGRVNH